MKIKKHPFPSHLEALKHKSEYFDVPDLGTKIQRHDNPHYWLQQDIVVTNKKFSIHILQRYHSYRRYYSTS